MSSLSGYDSAVPTQQCDSATPIKDIVNDAFEEWLDNLKSLVADAPTQVSRYLHSYTSSSSAFYLVRRNFNKSFNLLNPD